MADETTQPSLSTWETVKAGWNGFKDKVVGYVKQLPQAILVSAIFMGALMLAAPYLGPVGNLLGAGDLSNPVTFAKRLGIGLVVSALLSGAVGVYEGIHQAMHPAAPAGGAVKKESSQGTAPSRQPEVTVQNELPKIQPMPGKKQSAPGLMG